MERREFLTAVLSTGGSTYAAQTNTDTKQPHTKSQRNQSIKISDTHDLIGDIPSSIAPHPTDNDKLVIGYGTTEQDINETDPKNPRELKQYNTAVYTKNGELTRVALHWVGTEQHKQANIDSIVTANKQLYYFIPVTVGASRVLRVTPSGTTTMIGHLPYRISGATTTYDATEQRDTIWVTPTNQPRLLKLKEHDNTQSHDSQKAFTETTTYILPNNDADEALTLAVSDTGVKLFAINDHGPETKNDRWEYEYITISPNNASQTNTHPSFVTKMQGTTGWVYTGATTGHKQNNTIWMVGDDATLRQITFQPTQQQTRNNNTTKPKPAVTPRTNTRMTDNSTASGFTALTATAGATLTAALAACHRYKRNSPPSDSNPK